MATQAVTIAQDASTDAGWRVWGLAIHNALVALGTLVQTADTGQANWATATRAAGAYEMWAFSDSLQGTAPVFLRIGYGNAGSSPQLITQVGTATNGAGALMGNRSSVQTNNLVFTAVAQQYYFSSTTSRLTCWMEADANHGAGSNAILWSVERSHDNVGAETGTGIIFLSVGTSNSTVAWVSQGAGLPADKELSFPDATIWSTTGTLIGTQMTAFTVNALGVNFQVQNPPLSLMLYEASDVGLSAPGTLPAVTRYGTAHSYINTGTNPVGPGFTGSARFMMLYE